MISEKNAVLQYAYCDLIGIIIRSTRDHILDRFIESCMLPSAVVVVLQECARRVGTHSVTKAVQETYIECIITMVWTAAVISENGHCHTFLNQRIVEKVFQSVKLLDPEVFELNYIELA